jgi:hypothetical protein
VCCAVVCCVVMCCAVWCGVMWCVVLCCAVMCCDVMCGVVYCAVLLCVLFIGCGVLITIHYNILTLAISHIICLFVCRQDQDCFGVWISLRWP